MYFANANPFFGYVRLEISDDTVKINTKNMAKGVVAVVYSATSPWPWAGKTIRGDLSEPNILCHIEKTVPHPGSPNHRHF